MHTQARLLTYPFVYLESKATTTFQAQRIFWIVQILRTLMWIVLSLSKHSTFLNQCFNEKWLNYHNRFTTWALYVSTLSAKLSFHRLPSEKLIYAKLLNQHTDVNFLQCAHLIGNTFTYQLNSGTFQLILITSAFHTICSDELHILVLILWPHYIGKLHCILP